MLILPVKLELCLIPPLLVLVGFIAEADLSSPRWLLKVGGRLPCKLRWDPEDVDRRGFGGGVLDMEGRFERKPSADEELCLVTFFSFHGVQSGWLGGVPVVLYPLTYPLIWNPSLSNSDPSPPCSAEEMSDIEWPR